MYYADIQMMHMSGTVMQSIPVRQDNAIDQIVFSLVFDKPFDSQVIERFILLKNNGIEGLPESEVTNSLTISTGSTQTSIARREINGVRFYKPPSDETRSAIGENRNEWDLLAQENQVQLICTLYTSWNDVWSTAQYILGILNKCVSDDYGLNEFIVQVDDKFMCDKDIDYSIDDIFDRTSRYFNLNILEAGEAWHIYQGWFENVDDMRVLHNLNISTRRDDEMNYISTIIHLMRTAFMAEEEIQLEDFINHAAQNAHQKSKQAMCSILNQEALNRIGLTDA